MVLCFDIRYTEEGSGVKLEFKSNGVHFLSSSSHLSSSQNMDVIQKRTFHKTRAPADPAQPDGSERQEVHANPLTVELHAKVLSFDAEGAEPCRH